MNATELHLSDGRSAGIYFCAECKRVAHSKEMAEQCCAPYKCTYCGCDVDRKNYRTACEKCIAANDEKKERERFDAAEKLTEWDGPVLIPGTDDFYATLADYHDMVADDENPDRAFLWACDVYPTCQLDLDSIIENATSEAHEDFDSSLLDTTDLEKGIAAFHEANKSEVSWRPNYGIAIMLQPCAKNENDVAMPTASEKHPNT